MSALNWEDVNIGGSRSIELRLHSKNWMSKTRSFSYNNHSLITVKIEYSRKEGVECTQVVPNQ